MSEIAQKRVSLFRFGIIFTTGKKHKDRIDIMTELTRNSFND